MAIASADRLVQLPNWPRALAVAALTMAALYAPRALACVDGATIVLPDNGERVEVTEQAAYYRTGAGDESLAAARAAFNAGAFRRFESARDANFGLGASGLWLCLNVRAPASANTDDYELELTHPRLDSVLVIQPSRSDSLRVQRAGQAIDRSAWPLSTRKPTFRIPLAPGETRTVFVRITTGGTLQARMSVAGADAALAHRVADNHRQFLIYAVVLAMGLYNMLLFVSLRDTTYLYYVLFVVTIGATLLAVSGHAYQFLWPHQPALNQFAVPLLAASIGFTALQFSRSFLLRRLYLERIQPALTTLQAGFGLVVLLSPFVPYVVLAVALVLLMPSMTIALLAASIAAWRRGREQARFFVLSWSVFLAATVLQSGYSAGLLPSTDGTSQTIGATAGLSIVLLAFALADRLRVLNGEQREVLRRTAENLEQQVDERCAELQTARDRLAEANRRLQDLSRTDPLTGIYNRRGLEKLLKDTILHSPAQDNPLSVVMLDIDHFKSFNDTYGHQVGDSVLQHVAERLRGVLRRERDEIGRYGGEEFLALLPSAGAEDALIIAERMRSALADAPLDVGEAKVAVAVSAGVATLDSRQQTEASIRELIARADQSLYRAKRAGRNRVETA